MKKNAELERATRGSPIIHNVNRKHYAKVSSIATPEGNMEEIKNPRIPEAFDEVMYRSWISGFCVAH